MSNVTHPHDTFRQRSSRRQFLKTMGAAGLAASVVGSVALSSPAGAADEMPAYRIDYPSSVWVSVGTGRSYDVVVTDLDGNVLETHRGMNSRKLQRVASPYFSVTGIMPPA